MTRISTLFVVGTALAALALSVGPESAAGMEYGQQHSPTPKISVQTPKVPPGGATNQPTGSKKDFGWSIKPKAVK
jgi:hypothetical protein